MPLALRVRRRLGGWRQAGADTRVLHWLRLRGPPPPFDNGDSCTDATPEELRFLEKETDRLLKSGAWEPATDARFVSRVFLVAKPGHLE